MTPYIQNEFYWSVSAHNQLVTKLGLMENILTWRLHGTWDGSEVSS